MFDENIPTVPFISILYREHAKYLNEKVKDEDLSFGLYPLLIKIYNNEGIIQEQLAQNFHLNESTITRNLKKLEDKGFIERIPEKRTKRIEITDKGAETAQKVMDYDEEWDSKIKEIIGPKEYDNFKNALRKISEELI
ncbi:MarR family winged helix-turn-helix transcriptional regulator [Methanobrevibacter sp.]|uniref:MarR family winged helix-turn-helix transcriptional regulator n=1 Tax=Methanobrevibacter sp. TaxID=66852 RepID=UPI0025F292AE|nr:MarR family transcriptional regulator [Methanobrevibacter sp.]MBQ6512091.1 MarR family transcriptional regulator [Methanobrevibacter sp.]